MDLNRLTQKSQQAMQEAQSKALRYGHVEIDGEHLLLALLEQQDGLLPRLLTRMDVPVAALKSIALRLRQLIRSLTLACPGARALFWRTLTALCL